MAVVISGTNNSDKITATDGLIDLLSSVNFASEVSVPSFKVGSDIQIGNAGIITATTLVGNLQGNINHTSNLLLQISGSEKFRVGTSGQLGIGGANYGTSGQVLTSGGSSSAASWTTITQGVTSDGSQNTVGGTNAGDSIVSGGTENTVFGYNAGTAISTGDNNTFFGSRAGRSMSTGLQNTGVGYNVMGNTSGTGNAALGQSAGNGILGGSYNVALGWSALSNTNNNGTNNIVIGKLADISASNVSNEITLGNSDISHFRIPGIGVSFGRSGATIAGVVTATSFSGDGSALTGITQTTINNNADNRVITGSGTANTLNGESSLTYNGSSLKIGDTSFSNVNTGAENLIIGTESSGSNRGLSIITHSANTGHLFFGDQDNGTMGGFRYQNGADVLQGYSGGSAPFYLKSNALGLHENYPEAHSITIRGASQNDIPSLVIRKHTDGDTNHDEEIGRIKFKSNDNNVDSGNSVSRIELRAVHVNAAGAAKLEFYTVPNFTTNPVKTMTLNQEGRLCIGTDDAVAKLNVVHSSSDTTATGSGTLASCISVSNTNTTNNNFAGIVFGDRTDSQDFIGGIFTQITDHTQNYGNLVFYTNGSGGRTEKLRIAADGKVGMGAQTNPQGQLDIRTTNDDDAIRLVNTSTGNNGIQWWNEYGGLTKRVSMDYGEGDANFDIKLFRADAQDDRPYGNVRIFTGDYANPNMNFRVTTLGTVHQPNQPAFLVRDSVSSSAFGANSYADFDTVILNRGNHYNTSNGRFTAPIAGTYLFLSLMLSNGSSRLFHEIRKNGSRIEGTRTESGTNAGQYQSNTTQAIVDLAKGDWVAIHVGSGGAYGSAFSNFSGYLLG